MGKNELILFNPDIFHSVYLPLAGKGCNILVDKDYFESFRNEISEYQKSPFLDSITKQTRYTIINIENLPNAVMLAKTMFAQNGSKSYNTPSFEMKMFECQFREFLLCLLIAEKSKQLSIIGGGSSTYQDKITQILNYLRDNYTSVTLADLSKRFGYSPAPNAPHFVKIYRQHLFKSCGSIPLQPSRKTVARNRYADSKNRRKLRA